jgi:hypothetical protein
MRDSLSRYCQIYSINCVLKHGEMAIAHNIITSDQLMELQQYLNIVLKQAKTDFHKLLNQLSEDFPSTNQISDDFLNPMKNIKDQKLHASFPQCNPKLNSKL